MATKNRIPFLTKSCGTIYCEAESSSKKSLSMRLSDATRAAHLPLLFWDIFRNAFLKFRDGRILTLFLKRLGNICDVKDGLSPNMATQPGEYALVVPAEERKTSDHWDFEGNAVCIPLVSSSGHGKADIKRLHYQEGKFALATTMCALFSKDEEQVIPRYLFILLSRLSDQILVPLMCGATNVTMSSSQLLDLEVPIPMLDVQKEIIEVFLAENHASQIEHIALSLKHCSTNSEFIRLAGQVFDTAETLLRSAAEKIHIDSILAQNGESR